MKRKIAVGFLIVIALAVVAGGAYLTWLRTPPAMPDNMEQALAVTSSPRFERLSDAHKQRYLDRISELREQMTPEERQELRSRMREDVELRRAGRNVMMQMIMNRAKQVTAATGQERTRLLDEDIARFEAMRQAWGNRGQRGGPPGGPPGSSGPRGERLGDGEQPTDAEREQRRQDRRDRRRDFIQNMIEQGNPQQMAYMMEYRRAMQERREERGLPPMRGPGGRR